MTISHQHNHPHQMDQNCTPDIMLGAYLMSHLRPYCENCGTFDTPQWRKGWQSDVLGRAVLLCNACGLKYHKNQYCPYCHYVYGKEQEKQVNCSDCTDWLTCQSCGRWCHAECERRYGNEKSFSDNPRSYHCPNCRKSHHSGQFINNKFDLPKVVDQIDKLYKQEPGVPAPTSKISMPPPSQ